MKPNNGHGVVRALSGRIAAVLLGVVCALCVSATPALAAEGSITNDRTKATYTDIAKATTEAKSGDTLILGEGNYTLYGVSSEGSTKGKNLTFVGQGTDKTAWNIGAEVPNPDNFGTEYNGDYSFDGAGTVTFEKMTMRSGSANYLGFIRANKTVLKDCVVNGKTFYWGYESAEFNNTKFIAPSGDYAIWTYSSPTMTFNDCTFNATGKVINVYTDASAGKHDITVNVNNCTFNSKALLGLYKQALNINDSNMGSYKYIINITNSTATAERDNTTCSQLFGFGGKSSTNNTGRTDVAIDGKLVWSGGKMLTHSYTDGEQEDAFNVTYTEWTSDDAGTWTRTGTPKCKYCGFTKPEFEEKAFDLSYDMNGSDDKQPADFATVECVTEAEVVTDQPIRDGYSFEGWNTAKDGSGTSHAAGDKVELAAPMTLYAQWKKNEPAPQPKPAEPEPNKPGENTQKPAQKKVKSSVPATGDSINAALPVAAAIAGVALVGVVAIRKRDEH